MELIKDLKENQFGAMEGEVYFGWAGRYITITFEKDVPMDYVEKTANALNEIDGSVFDDVVSRMYRFYTEAIEDNPDMIEDIGMDDVEDESGIPEHFSLETLTVTMPEDPEQIGLNLDGACDWEENWIQCIIIDGELVYLGVWRFQDIWDTEYEGLDDNYAD